MPDEKLEKEFTLKWRLDCNAAGAVSITASRFQSKIEIAYENYAANAKEIMDMFILNAYARSAPINPIKSAELLAGDRVKLIIQGPDAAAALEALTRVFNFADMPECPQCKEQRSSQ